MGLPCKGVPWQKGGDQDMEGYPIEVEVERIMNVVRGFGWIEVKREVLEDELHLTIKKKVLTPEQRPGEVGAT